MSHVLGILLVFSCACQLCRQKLCKPMSVGNQLHFFLYSFDDLSFPHQNLKFSSSSTLSDCVLGSRNNPQEIVRFLTPLSSTPHYECQAITTTNDLQQWQHR